MCTPWCGCLTQSSHGRRLQTGFRFCRRTKLPVLVSGIACSLAVRTCLLWGSAATHHSSDLQSWLQAGQGRYYRLPFTHAGCAVGCIPLVCCRCTQHTIAARPFCVCLWHISRSSTRQAPGSLWHNSPVEGAHCSVPAGAVGP